jgi:cysteine-rich repeat protein
MSARCSNPRTSPTSLAVAALVGAALLASPRPADAAPTSTTLAVQGAVASSGAGPAPDGAYPMTFKLYDGPDANAQLLYTDVQVAVAVSGGVFATTLGAGGVAPPLPQALFETSPEVWLGVAVGADPELPRQRLAAVPYALQANHAESAVTAQTAVQAQQAIVAQQLACTGCVSIDMLVESALQASNHPAIYAGQPSTVQTALSGLDTRVGAYEAAVQAADGKLVFEGQPAKLVVQVDDLPSLLALQSDWLVAQRKDDGKYYGMTPLGWRPFRFDPLCGDGVLEEPEQCDEGPANADAPDVCRTNCQLPACGDGIQDAGELCDDGNEVDTDACVPGCKTASCGDGFVQAGVEDCDDGNADNTDACVQGCKPASCGDGFVQQGVEECDDGNSLDGDGCSTACKSELYDFTGVQTNLPISELKGWTECFKSAFNTTHPVSQVTAACTGSKMLMGCRTTGNSVLKAAAWANTSVVLNVKPNKGTEVSNGAKWYYNPTYSWGFVGANESLSLNSCDTTSSATRMCIHMGNNNLETGYRCGTSTGSLSGWERVFYTAP